MGRTGKAKTGGPPGLARLMLQLTVDSPEYTAIVGDFEEIYHERLRSSGIFAAKTWYWRQVLTSLPAFVKSQIYWGCIMFKNYFKTTVRNLLKHKGFSFINIAGLAIGMACSIMIMLWVMYELQYDTHHEKADQIYRVCVTAGAEDFLGAYTPPPLAGFLKKDFPEVEEAVRVDLWKRNELVCYKEKKFLEKDIIYSDGSIFDVFTIPFIKGSPEGALTRPRTLVISQSMARKYFGSGNPIGQTLSIDGRTEPWEITGVVEDCPSDSHFQYDFIGHRDWKGGSWGGHCLFTYIVLPQGYDPTRLQAKFPQFMRTNMGTYIQQEYGISVEEFLNDKKIRITFWLQPLHDIHLSAAVLDNLPTKGDQTYVVLFLIIGLFVLILACINFINLSTAKAATRAKEVGLRKVVGSTRTALIRQFLVEAVSLSFLALCLALILVEAMLPVYNRFLGKNLSVPYLTQAITLPILLGIVLVVGLLAGIYPALYLSAFRPSAVLKNRNVSGPRGRRFRTGLVVFQFFISIFVFLFTFVVFKQSHFLQSAKLGFNKDQVLVIQRANAMGDRYTAFKHALENHPDIMVVSNSDSLPGRHLDPTTHRLEGTAPTDHEVLFTMYGDESFAELLGLEVVDGRFFRGDIPTDRTSAVVINEAAVAAYGLQNPIGKRIHKEYGNAKEGEFVTIVGVVKNYNFHSLHHEIKPMIIRNIDRSLGFYIGIKLKSSDIRNTLNFIEDRWSAFTGNQPFEYSFLDQDFNTLYKSEIRIGQVLAVFSILAVAVAGLGLFGLASFAGQQRTKEIGIRKTLGASGLKIFILLTRDFSKWVFLATLLAWPLAYYTLSRWLQNFAYRTNVGVDSFLLSLLLAATISLVTVSYQSIRAAVAKPVHALRHE